MVGRHRDGVQRHVIWSRFGAVTTLHGPVRAWRGSAELPLGTPQQRATLALLLLQNGKPMTMDEITDALRGEVLPARPSATIRTYSHRLRRLLAADARDRVIAVDGGSYRIEVDPLAVDVGRFCEEVARADTALEEGRQDNANPGALLMRPAGRSVHRLREGAAGAPR